MRVSRSGQVAQLVEQRTENPRVDGSIPSLATKMKAYRTGSGKPFSIAGTASATSIVFNLSPVECVLEALEQSG